MEANGHHNETFFRHAINLLYSRMDANAFLLTMLDDSEMLSRLQPIEPIYNNATDGMTMFGVP